MTIGPPQSVWVQEEYNQKSEMKQALIGMTIDECRMKDVAALLP